VEDSSVQKQKDLSRIVSPSAYLLFYRRRSDGPLGGPRLKQVVNEYDNPQEQSEDELSESGEDRGLAGTSSSLRGSSSAWTGVGAALHLPNHGSVGGAGMTTINPSDLDKLPDYESHDPLRNNQLHPSVERDHDEGIDVEEDHNYNTFGPPNMAGGWDFAAINENSRNVTSGAASDIDVASDMAANDSSADEMEKEIRLSEFDNAEADEYVEQSFVPDMDDDGIASAVAIQHDLLENMHGNPMYHHPDFQVTADDTEHLDVEEPAAEIHIGDDEGMGL
jgi:ubiquitin carboxyl-terminal hydrolase 4/11/15